MTSTARDIVIPERTQDSAADAHARTTIIFRRLRELKRASKGDKHSAATVVIQACISEGFNTRARILGALAQLGFDHHHAATILRTSTGNYPDRYRWREESGVYHLND